MAHVVRWVTTERGLDAGDFALVAYGGAGPLHAAMVARELRIATVVIPRAPGHFSAYGMLVADLRRDFVTPGSRRSPKPRSPTMEAIFAEMEARGRETVTQGRWRPCTDRASRAADMRTMSARSTPVTVDLPVELFRSAGPRRHQAALRCGARDPLRLFGAAEKAEIVSLRSAVIGLMRKPPFEPIAAGVPRRREAFRGTRPVYFAEAAGFVDTPTYRARCSRPAIASPGRR